MNIETSLLIIVAVLGVSGALLLRPKPHWWYLKDRHEDSDVWLRIYTADQLPVVISALQAISEAFLLRKDDVYKLRPADKLHDIYNAAYPHMTPDAMEFELLSKKLMKDYKISEPFLEQQTDPTVQDVIEWCLQYRSV